ncbi:MAG TPA: rRNA maturation RNase YbeY [Alphaproteobacteria bacterium]|nr:rRNA maturation RNase YbeY [Alphaproteobacteria bacterium]
MTDDPFAIDVLVESAAWRQMPRVKALVTRAACAALAVGLARRRRVSLCIALMTDTAIARLNRDFLGKDRATDVLAFPQLPGNTRRIAARLRARGSAAVELGDVAVAKTACTRGARENGKRLTDHVAHLVVHGTLHLLGHDHARPVETSRMRDLERAALARLGIADPYRRAVPKPKARTAQ